MKNTAYTDMKSRFRVLAGIVQKDTLATLTIPNGSTTVELKTLPTWFEKLKYKLCGFEYKIIRETPSTYTDFNEANKSLVHHPYGDKSAGSEDVMTGEDLEDIIKELEAEVK